MEPKTGEFEAQCLEALKALGKTMLQLSLYEPSHPSVAATLKIGEEVMTQAIAASPRGSLVFAKDQDHWLANGRIIGLVKQVGGPVANLITRFRLSSIGFRAGLTAEELTAFCQLAASKPDEEIDIKNFLSERAIKNIRFNEAVYAKVDTPFRPGLGLGTGGDGLGAGPDAGPGAGAGAGPGAGPGTGRGAGPGDGGAGAGAGEGGAGSGTGEGIGTGEGGSGLGLGPGEGGAGPGAGPGDGGGEGGTGEGSWGDAGAGLGPGAGAGLGPGLGGGEDGAAIRGAIEGQSIEASLQILIRRVAQDPEEQARIYELIMEQLRLEIEQKVLAATKILRQDKKLQDFEQERTQSVLQNVGEGVIVIDAQGRILMMNPAAEEIYGAALSQVAGQPVTAKADDKRVVAVASEIEASPDGPLSKDIRVQGDDDVKRTIRASWAVVKNEAGRVVGMVLALTDLAKHRALAKVEREFVAHITHELRAPLTAIQASLDILKGELKGTLKPDQERIFASSFINTKRLNVLIGDILDFSKIESGQMTVYPKRADPEALAKEAVDSLKPWAVNKKVDLSLVADSTLPPVWADPRRTVQVLINILSNAIKFTPAGGSIVLTALRSRTEPDRWVGFSIADTGCGIPEAEQERVFEKFVQVSSGELRVGGTGLGLSIAKVLIELQGGQIWLESEAGKGTTFFFTLPIFKAPVPEAPPPPPKPWWKALLGLD